MEELGEITQLLLRFSPDALMVVDDGGRICFANETLTQLSVSGWKFCCRSDCVNGMSITSPATG
jgi:hypothetical protein